MEDGAPDAVGGGTADGQASEVVGGPCRRQLHAPRLVEGIEAVGSGRVAAAAAPDAYMSARRHPLPSRLVHLVGQLAAGQEALTVGHHRCGSGVNNAVQNNGVQQRGHIGLQHKDLQVCWERWEGRARCITGRLLSLGQCMHPPTRSNTNNFLERTARHAQ